MGRVSRIEYERAVYHVIQRGNNKEFIFKEDQFKAYFLKSMEKLIQELNFSLFGYVLMNNHYHLLLQMHDKPLQSLMHKLNTKYARYYNYKSDRVGHVFQGRYQSLLVRDESYLFAVLRYIHQNPVRANLCGDVDDYHWSSDKYYRYNMAGTVNKDLILERLAPDRKKAVDLYRQFVAMPDEINYEKGAFIGEKEIAATEETETALKELDKMLKGHCETNDDFLLIKAGTRIRKLTNVKVAFVKEALAKGHPKEQISQALSISKVALSDLLRRHSSKN